MKFNEIRTRQPILEINFNNPKLSNMALTANIQCGFEAETIWPGLGDGEFDDSLSYSDVYETLPSSIRRGIDRSYRDWVVENHLSEIESELADDWAYDNKSYYVDDFFDDQDLEREFDIWSEENDSDNKYDFLIDEYEDDYINWLRVYAVENEEIREDALERALEENTEDDWIQDAYYGDMREMFNDHGVDTYTHEGVIDEVVDILKNNAHLSKFEQVVTRGNYTDSWKVVEDGSLDGTGAEIISPVYDTPKEMLKEMKRLFQVIQRADGETDNSTGLHITMSWPGDEELNKLKMVLLLGDEYILSEFNRLSNTYTPSQYNTLRKALNDIEQDITDEASIKTVEKILSSHISKRKYASIHFKEETNDVGNPLIEFRIAGGDYLDKFDKITKAVTRYATIMVAGYNEGAFRKDYIRALLRLFKHTDATADIQTDDVHPSLRKQLDSLKTAIKSPSVLNSVVQGINTAYRYLDLAKFRKSDGKQPELFETTDINDWKFILKDGQYKIIEVIAYIALYSTKRKPKITATLTKLFRTWLREFHINPNTLWDEVEGTADYKAAVKSTNQRKAVGETLNALFRMDIAPVNLIKPNFTITYNSDTEEVFMIYKILSQVTQRENIRITPNMIVVISDSDLARIHRCLDAIINNDSRISYIKYSDKTDPKYIQELEEAQAEIEHDLEELAAFLEKYKYLPLGDSDPGVIGKYAPIEYSLSQLSDYEKTILQQVYNVDIIDTSAKS